MFAVVESVPPGMDVGSTRADAEACTFHTARYAEAAFRQIEANWPGPEALSQVKAHISLFSLANVKAQLRVPFARQL
jgi:hypothetical protein